MSLLPQLLLPLLLLLLPPQLLLASQQQLPWLDIQPSLPLAGQAAETGDEKHQAAETGAEKHWAVLVAGSNGWYNYRHQADICHAYQILRKNGVPADQIITMMYDDIAHNSRNPTPGEVINHVNGSDVYKGVQIDYKGKQVTPENFVKVLKGDGSGRVLKSGENDHVFINFADHGAPGLVAFPSSVLKAKEFISALTYMHENKMYKKMVIYVEACESGSMFHSLLPPNISIYATTAANPDESSYACYYDNKRATYLGDWYSVNWMEDSDRQNIRVETLSRQFQIVKEKTNQSHVMQYGDSSMGSLPVGEFQGNATSKTESATAEKSRAPQVTDAVSQRVATEKILSRRLDDAKTDEERLSIQMEIQQLRMIRARVSSVFSDIVRFALPSNSAGIRQFVSAIRYPLTDFDCHHAAVDAVHRRCFNLGETESALPHVYQLVNLCESRVGINRILRAIRMACPRRRL